MAHIVLFQARNNERHESNCVSPPPSICITPQPLSLGDVLQRLAWNNPDGLRFVEHYAREVLSNQPQNAGEDRVKTRPAVALAWQRAKPEPGWNARVDLQNPRPPAVPASLNLTLEEYYAAAALQGLLSAQDHEPDIDWATKWAIEAGVTMASEVRRRRQRKR